MTDFLKQELPGALLVAAHTINGGKGNGSSATGGGPAQQVDITQVWQAVAAEYVRVHV